jgi:hypothetical protein
MSPGRWPPWRLERRWGRERGQSASQPEMGEPAQPISRLDAPEFCGACQTRYTLRSGHRCEIDSDVLPAHAAPANLSMPADEPLEDLIARAERAAELIHRAQRATLCELAGAHVYTFSDPTCACGRTTPGGIELDAPEQP